MGLMVRWRQAWYLVNDITKERGEGRGEERSWSKERFATYIDHICTYTIMS